MLALSGVLAGLGRYDGVLGAAPASAFAGPDLPQETTMRVRVTGTPAQADERFGEIRSAFVLPSPMADSMRRNGWLPVEILFDDAPARPAYLETPGTWTPGTVLVVRGTPHSYWPLMDTGTILAAADPVLFIDAADAHEPLLFKR